MAKDLSYYVTIVDLEGAEYCDGTGFVPISFRYHVEIEKAQASSEHLMNKFGIELFEAIVTSTARQNTFNHRLSWTKE